jgi:ATP-binding cassette, subfamily B, bacterial
MKNFNLHRGLRKGSGVTHLSFLSSEHFKEESSMIEPDYKTYSPFRKLLSMIAEDRREFAAILVYSFIHSLLFLAVPLAAQGLVNVVVSGLYLQPLIVLTGALLFGLLAAGVLTLIRFYLVEVMRERIFARVALRVAERLPRVCHRTLTEKNGPELMNRFFDVINIQKSWFKLAYEGPGALLEILVGISLLGLYGTELFGLAFGVLISGALLIVLAGYRGLRTSLSESTQKYRVAEWLEEMVRNQDAIKVNSRPDYWAEETDRRVVSFLVARRKHFWVIVRQKSLYYALSAFALSGMLGMGGYLVIQGQLTLGQLVAAELVIWGVLKATQKMIGLTESFFDLLTGLEKVSTITTMEVDIPGSTHLSYGPQGAKVALDGLYFGYDPDHPPLFENLELQVGPGEIVTIVGGAGSGKSTLVRLLAGFLKPVRGSVEIDDVDLREFHPDSLAQNVSVLTGHADLFAGTLLENVSTGRDVGLHQVKDLLNLCGGRQVLRHLPNGANSVLSSGGQNLSGSEKECVLLTRSLAQKPRLLLLDESLYHLSEEQQRVLAQNLAERRESCTVISTVLLPNLVAKSDRILFLQDGQIQESFTPQEIARGPKSALSQQFPSLCAAVGAIVTAQEGV